MHDDLFNLQLFAEGAEGGDGGAEGAVATEAPQKATFEQILEDPDYKQAHDASIQAAIQRRFKGAKAAQDGLAAMIPMVSLMAKRYGIQPGEDGSYDYAAVSKAVMDDDAMLEAYAAQEGIVDIDAARRRFAEQSELDGYRREKARQEAAQREQQEEARKQEFVDDLRRQESELQSVYPGFVLDSELQNPDFRKLVSGGMSLRQAYQTVHFDDIMSGAIGYAAQRATAAAADTVAAGAMRPAEIGMGSPVGVSTTPKPLSKAEREEIRRRAMRGERVTF